MKYREKPAIVLHFERTAVNLIEQSCVFIPILWVYSAIINPHEGGIVGVIWLFFRALYPITFQFSLAVHLPCCTLPSYACIVYMLINLASATLF